VNRLAKEDPMGKISPQTTSKHLDLDGIEADHGALHLHRLSIHKTVTEPAPEVQLGLAPSGGHG
jgi:hypothetical protein